MEYQVNGGDYGSCMVCPRKCGVDRSSGGTGFCLQSDRMVLACVTRHFGEEPPLVGVGGSGTLFFSGCTLRCGYCQNRQLSRSEVGEFVSPRRLVELCLGLQAEGAENINLVSGTLFIPTIEGVIQQAREKGLRIPVVWNSSGYETPEMVRRLSSFVEIFMPDLKLLDPVLAGRLLGARDYPEVACGAVLRMAAASGMPVFDGDRLRTGTIVRHLVLPGLMEETRRVLKWFPSELRDRVLLSLMVQFYVPPDIRGWRRGVRNLENRQLTGGEYETLLSWLEDLQIDEGFIQEIGDDVNWWPDFNRYNPFPGEYSKILWSCGGK